MSTHQNRIQTPPNLHIKVVITVDPNTNQSEMKIERGKITNLQLATMLNEHATNIMRQLVTVEAKIISNDSFGKVGSSNGGNNDAA